MFGHKTSEEQFFDADEPTEMNSIFQVVGLSKVLLREKNQQLNKESQIENFVLESLTHPNCWTRSSTRQSQVFGRTPNAPDFVFVMGGKWKVPNGLEECKIFRFTVIDKDVQSLWNHLKRATSLAPKENSKLWIEILSEKEQEEAISDTAYSVPDSGYPNENFVYSEQALTVDYEGKWTSVQIDNQKFTYIYFMFTRNSCTTLKQLVDREDKNKTGPADSPLVKSVFTRDLLRLAEHIKELHSQKTVHGNITLRNVLFFGDGLEKKVFIASECFFFAKEEIFGDNDHAKKRRKFFDGEQRDDPAKVDMACDVFAFGLIIVELMGKLKPNQKNDVTKNIRTYRLMDSLKKFSTFAECRQLFGNLLEKIFVPRHQRITIGEVVLLMREISHSLLSPQQRLHQMSLPQTNNDEEEIKKLRQERRDEYASKTAVRFLLPIGQRAYLVNLILSFTISITIVGIGVYLYQVGALVYHLNSQELFNFLSTSAIMGVIIFGVKRNHVDTYVQRQILSTLFVMRSDAILRGEIPESFMKIEDFTIPDMLAECQQLLQFFKIRPLTTTTVTEKEYSSGSDLGTISDESETEMDLPEFSKGKSGKFTATGMSEPGSSRYKPKSLKKKTTGEYTGFWETTECKLYQFEITQADKESKQAKLKDMATWLPPTQIWIEQARFDADGEVQDTSAEEVYYTYLMIKVEKPLKELIVQRRISSSNLNFMRHYAEHVHKLHQKGYFSNLSLSNAYWKPEGLLGGSVVSFSPDWVEADPLPEQEKLKEERNDIVKFGAVLLDVLYGIEQSYINEIKNKSLVYLSKVKPEEVTTVLGHSRESGKNNKLEELLTRIFGAADERPTMAHIAFVLNECYNDRVALGTKKAKPSTSH